MPAQLSTHYCRRAGWQRSKIYAKPSNLYRYRPLGAKAAREVRALQEGFIFCPAYSAMNDPMEGLHRLSSRLAENPSSEKSRARIQEALQKMGIASMSEVYDHEPMWAHYADQFAGMCVQYSLNRLIKGLVVVQEYSMTNGSIGIHRHPDIVNPGVQANDNKQQIGKCPGPLSSDHENPLSQQMRQLPRDAWVGADREREHRDTKLPIQEAASD